MAGGVLVNSQGYCPRCSPVPPLSRFPSTALPPCCFTLSLYLYSPRLFLFNLSPLRHPLAPLLSPPLR